MIKFFDKLFDSRYTAIPNYLSTFFYLLPLLILSSYPLHKNTMLSTDPEEDSPGPDSYTLMEDAHDIEEQPMRTRAHTNYYLNTASYGIA